MNCPIWKQVIKEESEKEYYKRLMDFLDREYLQYTIYPRREHIFRSLEVTPYEYVKVVILGQDPYHGKGQAHGMSFSVQEGAAIPPSLRNIYKELHSDLNIPIPTHGNLQKWAEQGVLLLNTVLTVRDGEANSHKGKGWEQFTDQLIMKVNENKEPVVFVLWGKHAQQKEKLITNQHHYKIISAHPSPLSARRGFFESKPFSKINDFLEKNGISKIHWEI